MENAENKQSRLFLLAGGKYHEREDHIASRLALLGENLVCAVIMEGLPTASLSLSNTKKLTIVRTAPGCLCCIGNLVMRVTLTRLLRLKPDILFIAIQDASHLEGLRTMIAAHDYGALLNLEDVTVF
ncbi:MAG: GTPase [Undibacterium sp.]|nr:GTPase [Undibacterium sp.]